MVIERINLFPPEFMKGTQSLQILNDYIKANPQLADLQMSHKTGTWNLKDCLTKHAIDMTQNNKKQNHYITSRTYKYHLLLSEAIEKIKLKNLCHLSKRACLKRRKIRL